MKVILENLGPICKFEFDLTKDLNLIFGKNNVGKSYAISSLYILLKHFINQSDFFAMRYGRPISNMEINEFYYYSRHVYGKQNFDYAFNKKLDELNKDSKLLEVDITDSISITIATIINNFLSDKITKSFNASFGDTKELYNRYSKKPLSIKIYNEKLTVEFGLVDGQIIANKVVMDKPVYLKRSKTSRNPYFANDYIRIYATNAMIKASNKNSKDAIRSVLSIFDILSGLSSYIYHKFSSDIAALIQNVYFLPASRSGLYQALSTFSAVIAELSKSRNFVSATPIELPAISEPVSDYFLKLSNIGTTSSVGKVSEIARQIESDILGGVVNFNKETRKMIFIQNNIGSQWDLSVTSSMISEIAPIVAYLKFIVDEEPSHYRYMNRNITEEKQEMPYNLIFIEEPEAHLHPEIQVKLMVFFTMLVKHRIKIIMTTHSNYMFNKLNNLILDDKIDYNVVGSYLMKKTDNGSVADSISMQAVEYGIEDENFADVAEQLYNERLNIYEKKNG